MRITSSTSLNAGRRRSLRRLAGSLTGTLSILALLSACGTANDPPADDADATPASAAAAQEIERDDAGTDLDAAEPSESTDSSPTTEPESKTEAEDEPETDTEAEPEPVEPQSYSGTGAEVVIIDPLGEDVFYATVAHDGSSNFAMWSVDENGQDIDLLVNEIGDYDGDVALNFAEDPAALRVEADGAWSIDLVPLQEAPRWDGSAPFEATGDSIVIVAGVAEGLTPVTLTHDGESNFAIWAWGESHPDLIVNDIGTYDGTTLLPDGSLVLQVNADGNWTISTN
ncbi:hypothetical protein [Brachybacterium massiliense]|uniref:hypothetical protein n=1 Tax=Brachybacterium massiliense TaxID=1755098 RepID=UPI000B3BC047|nr:hypothetical protein [Brachybacterium massiliense]